MEHFFELPVTHWEEQLILNGRLVTFAYSYKFYIIVDGQELIFEKDDEGQFRIIGDPVQPQIGKDLLSDIIKALENSSSLDKTA